MADQSLLDLLDWVSQQAHATDPRAAGRVTLGEDAWIKMIVDWHGVEKDGQSVEFISRAARDLLAELPLFRKALETLVRDLDRRVADEVQEAIEEPTSCRRH